jgi:hypothetical protein
MQDANALHLPFEGLAPDATTSEAMCRLNLIRTADSERLTTFGFMRPRYCLPHRAPLRKRKPPRPTG